MIGLGKWDFDVDTIFFKGNAQVEIKNNNGKYEFSAVIPDVKIPDYFISDIKEEGNTLLVTGGSDLLPGKSVTVSLTFEGNTCNGIVNAPFVGKIKLKNGRKI